MATKQVTVQKYVEVISALAAVMIEHPVNSLTSYIKGRSVSTNLATWLKQVGWITEKKLTTSGRTIFTWTGPYPVSEAQVVEHIIPKISAAFEKADQWTKQNKPEVAAAGNREILELLERMEVQLIKQTALLEQLVSAFTK